REDAHAVVAACLGEAGDRLARAGIAADLLVQHDVDAVGLEIRPDVPEEIARVLAVEDLRGIADARLAPLQLVVILALICLAGRDIADLLETEGNRVVGPDI